MHDKGATSVKEVAPHPQETSSRFSTECRVFALGSSVDPSWYLPGVRFGEPKSVISKPQPKVMRMSDSRATMPFELTDSLVQEPKYLLARECCF